MVLDQLAHYGTYDKLDQQLRALVNARSIAELYEQVLSNWESALAARGHASAIGNVLKVLWCSRYGISEEDLFAASGVARAVWMSLFALIRSSLVSTLPGMLAIAHLDLRSVRCSHQLRAGSRASHFALTLLVQRTPGNRIALSRDQ